MARLLSLSLFALLIAELLIPGVVLCAKTIELLNKCNETVWPGIKTKGGSGIEPGLNTGYALKKDESKSMVTASAWNGTFWGRTQCAEDDTTGKFTCLTGDCGSSKQECSDAHYKSGTTFVDVVLNGFDGLDSLWVNVGAGFNLPIMVVPQGGTGPNCSSVGCIKDMNDMCPSELIMDKDAQGKVVACISACGAFSDDPSNCKSETSYSKLFKTACPIAYTYSNDDKNNTRSCAGGDYQIIFCPTSEDTRILGKACGNGAAYPKCLSKQGNNTTIPEPGHNAKAPGPGHDTKVPGPGHETKVSGTGNNMAIGPKIGAAGGAAVASILFLSLLFFIRYRRFKTRHNSSSYPKDVEDFIKRYGPSIPKRFRYSTLKKITNSFKEELGKGGYGNVYKGKLSDGSVVAVKVLIATKGNGEEFINEVASIGRTSHVNVVSLLGFVYEGKKRALIYEFMPNGSLEKFIHGTTPSLKGQYLCWEKLYSIALGIARGLEYLHYGCSTQILHFDIKPHNILLDEDFCPKISDFGLAKLYSRKESVLSSILQARGTVGYIAPELTNKSFGPVSHKSDVYSYGMMILEMVGGRKNIETRVERSSQIYFPRWVYKHIHANDEETSSACNITEEENHIVRKMMIVGLWCIQTNPLQRPSISKVIEMLEGDLEALEIPPKPYMCSPPPTNSPSIIQQEILSGSSSSPSESISSPKPIL